MFYSRVQAILPLFFGCVWWPLCWAPVAALAARASTPPVFTSHYSRLQRSCCGHMCNMYVVIMTVIVILALIASNICLGWTRVVAWAISPAVLWWTLIVFAMLIHMFIMAHRRVEPSAVAAPTAAATTAPVQMQQHQQDIEMTSQV